MFSKGLIFSAVLHSAIIVVGVIGYSSSTSLDVTPPKPIPVDIITPSEFTKIKAGEKKPEKKPEKKSEETKSADVKDKKKPEKKAVKTAKKENKPKPKPKKKPAKTKAVREATRKKPLPRRKPTPQKAKKPAKKKAKKKVTQKKPPKKPVPKNKNARIADKDFSPDRIAALLNKIPDSSEATASIDQPQNIPQRQANYIPEGLPGGHDLTLSVNEIDALRAKISQCWVLPIGGLGADRIIVRIQINLEQDGNLVKQPRVLNSSGSPFFRSAAESAIRAIVDCQPYQLPKEKFKVWRDIVLNFDPSQMYGG